MLIPVMDSETHPCSTHTDCHHLMLLFVPSCHWALATLLSRQRVWHRSTPVLLQQLHQKVLRDGELEQLWGQWVFNHRGVQRSL